MCAGVFMDRLHFSSGFSAQGPRVEEVDPRAPSDVPVARAAYRVQEVDEAMDEGEVGTCREIIAEASPIGGASLEDEEHARMDLVVLLMSHPEFATHIKAAVRDCMRLGHTLRATYVYTEALVQTLRSTRKREAFLKIAGGVTAGVGSGMLAGFLRGGPAGAIVGTVVSVAAHFSPWGVFNVFREVDREAQIGLDGLFAGDD
jgi:hypothetical protein